jgi:hypothetical protein
MTDSNVVSLKAITPPRWEGELTTGLLDMYVNGLKNTNHEVGRRLAYELREARKSLAQKDARIAELEAALAWTKEESTFIARGMVNDLTELDRALAAEKARHDVTQKALERLSMSIITKAGSLGEARGYGKPTMGGSNG